MNTPPPTASSLAKDRKREKVLDRQAAIQAPTPASQVGGFGSGSDNSTERRWGTILAVLGGGTVQVDVAGTPMQPVTVLDSYAPVVGDRVVVEVSGGDPLVLGSAGLTSTGTAGWQTYNTAWTCATVNPTLGNGTLLCRYSRSAANTITFRIYLLSGSTTSGGEGGMFFTLPVLSAPDVEQSVVAKLFTVDTSQTWGGIGQIGANTAGVLPLFPASATSVVLGQLNNTSNGTAGTGNIPAIGSHYPIAPGSTLIIEGTYESAT